MENILPFFGYSTGDSTGDPKSIIFSTGLSTSGELLKPGSVDPHWTLISSPDCQVDKNLLVVAGPNDDKNSGWVGVTGTFGSPGYYTIRQIFDLQGYDPTTTSIKFSIIVNDVLSNVLLNGTNNPFVQTKGFFSPWMKLHGPFVNGKNTVDFVFYKHQTETPSSPSIRIWMIQVTKTNY